MWISFWMLLVSHVFQSQAVLLFSVARGEWGRPVCREWKPRDSMWLCRKAAPQGVGPSPGVADGLLSQPRGRRYRSRVCGPRPTRGTENQVHQNKTWHNILSQYIIPYITFIINKKLQLFQVNYKVYSDLVDPIFWKL